MYKKVFFPYLDILRGPAALLVFAEHFRNLFFLDYVDVPHTILNKLIYSLTSAGHEAVIVFFVLSGCVISHVIHTMFLRNSWSWINFFFDRLSRLWIVLIPALILTFLWDSFGMYLSHSSISIYDGNNYANMLKTPVSGNSSVLDFISNIFFLQSIVVPTYGSNGPLWSISYEFVFYILLAFSAVPIYFKLQRSLLLLWLFFAFLVVILPIKVVASFLLFLLGSLAYYLYVNLKWSPSKMVSIFGIIVACFSLVAAIALSVAKYSLLGLNGDFLIAIAVFVFVYFSLNISSSQFSPFLGYRSISFASLVSYSLYLFHTPLLVFIASNYFVANSERWTPSLEAFLPSVVIVVTCLAYSVFMWWLFERNTKSIKAFIRARC